MCNRQRRDGNKKLFILLGRLWGHDEALKRAWKNVEESWQVSVQPRDCRQRPNKEPCLLPPSRISTYFLIFFYLSRTKDGEKTSWWRVLIRCWRAASFFPLKLRSFVVQPLFSFAIVISRTDQKKRLQRAAPLFFFAHSFERRSTRATSFWPRQMHLFNRHYARATFIFLERLGRFSLDATINTFLCACVCGFKWKQFRRGVT